MGLVSVVNHCLAGLTRIAQDNDSAVSNDPGRFLGETEEHPNQ